MQKSKLGHLIKTLLVLAATAFVINTAIPSGSFADILSGYPDPPVTDTISCDTTQVEPTDCSDDSTGDPLLDLLIDMVGWVL